MRRMAAVLALALGLAVPPSAGAEGKRPGKPPASSWLAPLVGEEGIRKAVPVER